MTADDKPLHMITVGKGALTIREYENGNSQKLLDLEDCDSSSLRTGKMWNTKAGTVDLYLGTVSYKLLSLSGIYVQIFLLKQLLKKEHIYLESSIYLFSSISIFIYLVLFFYVHLYPSSSSSIHLFISI